MRIFKTIVLSILLFSLSAQASNNFLGKEAERAVVIAIQPDSTNFVSGKTAKFHGSIKITTKPSIFDWFSNMFGNSKNLLEEFKKQGVEIAGTFPSSTADVTSNVKFKSTSKNEIEFTYESSVISSSNLNQFSLRVLNNTKDKDKLKRLAAIQAKLERRLSTLQDLKKYFERNKALSAVMAVIEKEIESISSLREKIQNRIDNDDNVIAENTTAIQVDNKTTAFNRISTTINGFRFSLQSDVGVPFDGTQLNVKALVAKIGSEDKDDDYYKYKGKYGYLGEIVKDGKLLQSSIIATNATSLSFDVPISKILRSDVNKFELSLYRTEKNKKKDKVGSLAQTISVLLDSVSPVWLAQSSPSGNLFVKSAPDINLFAFDSFGRIDPSSLVATLNGTSSSAESVSVDLASKMTVTKDLDGAQLTWSAVAENLNDGIYSLYASVKDLSKNTAKPNPYSAKIVIDNTPPVIAFGAEENYESPVAAFALNLVINDLSPVSSTVYLNNVEIGVFDTSLILVPTTLKGGVNKFKVVSIDLAGNRSESIRTIIFDTTPPVLSLLEPLDTQKIYTNVLPIGLNVQIGSNEALSEALLNGSPMVLGGDQLTAGTSINISAGGIVNFNVKAKDIAGNQSSKQYSAEVVFDDIAPVIALSYAGPLVTNSPGAQVKVSIQDQATVTSKVIVNSQVIFETGATEFSIPFELNTEGKNTFQVESIDFAGNKSSSKLIEVVRDTTSPILRDIRPQQGEVLKTNAIEVSAFSNEALSSASINGFEAQLSGDRKQLSGFSVPQSQGAHEINIIVRDLAGNLSSTVVNVDVTNKLLIQELVSIYPNRVGDKLIISGAIGATRAGAEVSASESLFSLNRASTIASDAGSFTMEMGVFESVTISAKDINTGETESFTLNLGAQTTLAGIVKDVNGNPLVGVTVGVIGQNVQVTTDGNGAFKLNQILSGDQTLYVDGSTAIIQPQDRRYSKTNVSINIGTGQQNVLESPIYLAPILLDGSATKIVSGSAATVINVNAPNVVLSVPAGSATFPDGTKSGSISMVTIPFDRSTIPVPEGAVPSNVIALEPSGLKFSTPVQLTLPNNNELPAGVELVILSMNSLKGRWEIDGLASVTPDGLSVVTKPGYGISHFSLVYAVPISPVISPFANESLSGIDASSGSLSTSVEMPSYKISSDTVKPTLYYKSNWARPTATVVTAFSIPKQKVSIARTYDRNQNIFYSYGGNNICRDSACSSFFYGKKDYWISSIVTSTWYQPESISSKFYVGTIASDGVNIDGGMPDVPSDVKYTEQKTFSGANAKYGIKNEALIGYGLELNSREWKNDNFLASGIYPSVAKYSIKLKSITLNTVGSWTTSTDYKTHKVINTPNDPLYFLEQQSLKDVFPRDVTAPLLVQNKRSSTEGAGWHNGFVSRIVNPNGSRIMIEEQDGSLSTYGISNTISTIAKGEDLNVDLKSGVDLTKYPNFYATRITGRETKIVKGSFDSQVVVELSGVSEGSGTVADLFKSKCNIAGTSVYDGYSIPFLIKSNIQGVFASNNGDVFFSNQTESLIRKSLDGEATVVAGTFGRPRAFPGQPPPTIDIPYYPTGNTAGLDAYCTSQYGQNCDHNKAVERKNITCTPCKGTVCNYPAGTDGTFGQANMNDISGDNSRVPGLNAPIGITMDGIGRIIVADTGNNKVRALDLANSTYSILVGDGKSIDSGEGVAGAIASIFHPRGVTYDRAGNLYISSEAGYIRRLDAFGNITTFAGKSVSNGGLLSDEAPASQMAFSMPSGMVYDSNNDYLYIADTGYNRVVRIDVKTMVASVIAGSGVCSSNNIGDSNSAIAASICAPTSVGLDSAGNLLIGDTGHNSIRKVVFSNTNGNIASFLPSNLDLSTLSKKADSTWERTLRNGVKIEYDSQGYRTSLKDLAGNGYNYTYEVDHRLSSVIDRFGRASRFNYSGSHLSSFVDPAGRTTYFFYLGDLLEKVIFPDNSIRRFEYNDKGLLSSVFDGELNQTQYIYDEWNKLSKVINSDQTVNAVTTLASQIASASVVGNSPLIGQNFGENGVHEEIRDANGAVTEVLYGVNGTVLKIKNAKEEVTTINSDQDGKVESIVDASSFATKFKYDLNTQDLIESTDVSTNITLKYEYDKFGKPKSKTDGNGQVTYFEYDALKGWLASQTMPNGLKINYIYGAQGTLTSRSSISSDGQAQNWSYLYDQYGNQISVIYPDGKVNKSYYDLFGNVIKFEKWESGVMLESNSREFDLMNRLVKVVSSKGEVTKYRYNRNGLLLEIEDAKSNKISFAYDSIGRLIKKTDALGFVSSFTYDLNGHLKSQRDPNGNESYFTYDILGRMSNAVYPDDSYLYGYDQRGMVTSATNSSSQVFNRYDGKKRLIASSMVGAGVATILPSSEINYGYDGNDNLTTVLSADSNTSMIFDNLNQVKQISDSHSGTFTFFYDGEGKLSSLQRTGSTTNFGYNQSKLLESIKTVVGGNVKASTEYRFDGRNYPIGRRSNLSEVSTSYDQNGQMIKSNDDVFEYDSIGNRTSDSIGSFNYDGKGQRLLEDYTYSYSYDNNGNLIQKIPKNADGRAYQYRYSSRNQLVQIKEFDSALGNIRLQVDYVYDVLGRRIQKRIADHNNPNQISRNYVRQYLYDGANIIAEYDGSGSLLVRYVYNRKNADDLLSLEVTSAGVAAQVAKRTGVFYVIKDAIGSSTDLIDGQGAIVESVDYSAFGSPKIFSNGVDVTDAPVVQLRHLFAGREWDSESNLYYYRARYYDSSLGRFLQEDPDAGSIFNSITVSNKYAYAGNSPSINKDPTGKWIWFAIVGAIIGGIDASNRGENWLAGAFLGAVAGMLIYYTWDLAAPTTFFGALSMPSHAVGFAMAISGPLYNSATHGGSFIKNFMERTLKGQTILAAAASQIDAAAERTLWGESGSVWEKALYKMFYVDVFVLTKIPSKDQD